MSQTLLKNQISALIEQGQGSDAAYVQAADLLEGADLNALPPFRLAILRSFTLEPLVEILKVKFFLEGFRLELFLGEFNQYPQEILDPSSRFYRFKPEVTLFAVRLEELSPRLFNEFGRLKVEEIGEIQAELLQRISGWAERIGEYSKSHLVLSNFLVPTVGVQGLCDTQTPLGQVSVVRALNGELLQLRQRFSHVSFFDLELLASRIGKETFCDSLQEYRMSNPYRLSVYPAYGEALMAHLRALRGPRKKCLVLDLDNTLWGGTLGEDGLEGVVLSDSYPGNCFKDFQRALLQLAHRGVLLAINSKNNPEEGIEMLRSHPDMVLREEHWSAIRINWKDKVDNLRDIALELNLGLDSLVFVDDSPVECERVRQACPEVLVVQLPQHKHLYRKVIENLGCFEQLALTEEDRGRVESYRGQSQRQRLATQAATLEQFYASLEMRGLLSRNEAPHVHRIAQMTQKTNQFNLTARRYTETEITRFMQSGFVYSLQMEDRFGDNGIVAAAILIPERGGEEWVIDTLLMSCRVILRTIEDTLIAHVAHEAAASGARCLIGRYIPSGRNQMVSDFYDRRGFSVRSRMASGEVEYLLDLSAGKMPEPSAWIQLATKSLLHR